MKISWDLAKLNRVLLGIFLFVLGWFLLDVLLNLGKSGITVLPPLEIEQTEVSRDKDLRQLPDFEYYAKEINRRQLFKGVSLQEKPPSSTAPQDTTRILPSDFQLVGIAGGIRPQAIIQNKKTNQTYFLFEGQTQDNLKVEEISGNKVKLNYEGELFERSL